MDDLTLIPSFRAERADNDPRPRAAAWRALEARFDPAPAGSSTTPIRSPRRGLLALAGTGAVVAAVAGILVFGSGPTAEPAAAEVLREIATVAADSPPESPPGPGQFLYTKTKMLGYESWVPGDPISDMNRPDAFTAFVPTDRELWLSPDGGRMRETMGTPQFLSSAEESRWKQAGSPLPRWFDPSNQDNASRLLGDRGRLIEARRGTLDIEYSKTKGLGGFAFGDVGDLPTEPDELRLAIQNESNPWARALGLGRLGRSDTEKTILALWAILGMPNAGPALRAAAFNALAEMPGIELESDVTDLAGRSGDAIRYSQGFGIGNEYIFDPETSEVLGLRTVVVDPKLYGDEGIPAGTVISDVAYLQSKVVDSTREPLNFDQRG